MARYLEAAGDGALAKGVERIRLLCKPFEE
jgi:hypothetical protein